MRSGWVRLLIGLALVLAGSLTAARVQTAGGVRVSELRIPAQDGVTLSALLYRPANATPATPAPGVLAVHGYINSKQTQSGFAIEFARRGYVVLSLDQTGHGESGGAAFSQGFGGPAALAALRALSFVDRNNIGLEGHSMGGWTVLAAARAQPDGYRSMVLEGSSTGAPFAAPGTPTWPRNVAVVFSRYDEFSQTMWSVPRARDVAASPKLQALFGVSEPVVAGWVYGSIPAGTARVLYDPPVTHPGDHVSTRAIGHSLDWFARTLQGGTPRPAGDQIWPWKELATGVALVGFAVLLLGVWELGLASGPSVALQAEPSVRTRHRGRRWWTALVLSALTPVLLYFPAFLLGSAIFPASAWAPQSITNQIVVWMLISGGVSLLIGRLLRSRDGRSESSAATIPLALALAIGTTSIGYLVLAAVEHWLHVDFRFWVVALQPLTADQAVSLAVYVWPITGFFVLALDALQRWRPIAGEGRLAAYAGSVAALAGGFVLLLALTYGWLFVDGRLLTAFDPLNTIVAIQFAPLLVFIAVVSTFTWRRTGSAVSGALLCGLVVSWYIVAGTATHVV